MEIGILFAVLCVSLYFLFRRYMHSGKSLTIPLQASFLPGWENILLQRVDFYRKLNEADKIKFRDRVSFFLSQTPVSGAAGVEIDDETRLLVAASAIIPVFKFENWHYINLNEVVIYKEPIESYRIEESGSTNSIIGQVRPFQTGHVVLLSKPLLLAGFSTGHGKENVGIHEFSHLIDQIDGKIDGVPEVIFSKELLKPWFHLMYNEIERIKKGKSDINPYGLTNHAEFFAVVSEYFFEDPEKFGKKHPELYQLLSKAFRRENK